MRVKDYSAFVIISASVLTIVEYWLPFEPVRKQLPKIYDLEPELNGRLAEITQQNDPELDVTSIFPDNLQRFNVQRHLMVHVHRFLRTKG